MSNTPRTDAIAKRFEGRDTRCLTYRDVEAIVALSRSLEEEVCMAMRLNKAMRDEMDERARDAATEQRWADKADAEGVPHGSY